MSQIVFANNATSYLIYDTLAASATITVSGGDGAKFPTIVGDQIFPVTVEDRRTGQREIMTCTARAGDILTVLRGQEGTTAQDFVFGATVSNRLTAATLASFQGLAPDYTALYVSRYSTLAAAAASVIPGLISTVMIDGYTAAGDGGGGIYRSVGGDPGASPKFLTSNGRWFALDANQALNALMFGATPASAAAGVANSTAFNLAITFSGLRRVPVQVPGLTFYIGDNTTLDTCLLAKSYAELLHAPGATYINRAKGRDLNVYCAGNAATRLQSAAGAQIACLVQVNGIENGSIENFQFLGKPTIDGESNVSAPSRAFNLLGEINGPTLTAKCVNLASNVLVWGDDINFRYSKGKGVFLSLDYSGFINGQSYEMINIFPMGSQADGGPSIRNLTFYDCDIDVTAGVPLTDTGHGACCIKLNYCDGVHFAPRVRLRGGTQACLNMGNGTRRVTGVVDCGDSSNGVLFGHGINNLAPKPTGHVTLDVLMQAAGTTTINSGRLNALTIQGAAPGVACVVNSQAGGVELRTNDYDRFTITGVSAVAGKACTISIVAYPGAAIVTEIAHGRTAGCPFKFSTTGALPWWALSPGNNPFPLVAGRTYYVRSVIDADHFTLCATAPALAISTLGLSQAGAHTFGGVAATISLANPAVITQVAHGRAAGSSAALATAGTLPSSLPAGTYFVRDVLSADTFTLVASLPIVASTTGSQSGVHATVNCIGHGGFITTTGGAKMTIQGYDDAGIAPAAAATLAVTRAAMVGTPTAADPFATQDNKVTGVIGVVEDVDALFGARVTGSIKSGYLAMLQPTIARSPARDCHFDLACDGLDTGGVSHPTLATSNSGGATWWMEQSFIRMKFINPPGSCFQGYGKGNKYNLWSLGNGGFLGGTIFQDYGQNHTLEEVGVAAGQTRHNNLWSRESGSLRLTVLKATGPANMRWLALTPGQDITRGPGSALRADFLLSAAAANQVLRCDAGQYAFITGIEFVYPDGTTASAGVEVSIGRTKASPWTSNPVVITTPVSQAAGSVVTLGQTEVAGFPDPLLLDVTADLQAVLYAGCAGGKAGADRITMLVHIVPMGLAT